MFLRTFETGARHPEKRPDAKAWMKLFAKLARQVAYCPECRHEMFTEGDLFDCPICKKKSRIQRIRVHTKEESYRIPFYKNQEISPFEVEGEGDRKRNFPFHDGLLPMAKVVESNGKPYLVNLDPRGKVWTCSYESIGQSVEYGAGNLFAKNACMKIPVREGEWVIWPEDN